MESGASIYFDHNLPLLCGSSGVLPGRDHKVVDWISVAGQELDLCIMRLVDHRGPLEFA